ncbi:glycoside hydrolase family 30 protein [Formosa sp. PL04]|uniref:glycoside hydrolase family 30 protein n=1 Tax=Formosa sp. PL04 TaxID=3081755 RepID=UPI0029820BB4|nr:glycoside hydrolase family 30 protein [Formosa sp. PL04]MDW5288909.1 glycoside hydrolase family 30 protein [Formosa sp. PL04]
MTYKYFILLFSVFTIVSCSKTTKKEAIIAEIIEESPSIKNEVEVYATVKDSDLKLTLTGKYKFEAATQPLETEVSIFVNTNKTFQTMLGIGGAITDASAVVFSKLPKDKQEELIQAYYGEDGIGYNIIRTSIHSSDFSPESFTYIEEGDKELTTFSIEKDKEFRIPMIKKAIDVIKDNVVFYASPWSPPPFMKGRKDMLQGGKLLPEFQQSWANYYTEFIKAYEAEGIPVWGVTIQNEPMAVQRWESCIYTAEEERDFLKNYLGPTFEREGYGDKKIVVWDHNRDLISHRANVIFDDPEAAKYAWGIGFHWYETWSGAEPNYNNLQNINDSFPTKNLLFTEGCQEAFDPTHYQRWSNAERYGNSMINDFNNGTVGWTDWNILLDETGGPNHVQNFCFAPIHGDTQTGKLIYTPSYYYIGHFSKFIKPGAKRVSTTSSRSTLESTTFINENGTLATIVMNRTKTEILYKLIVDEKEISLQIPAHAMQTVTY